jgi:hypothetical protein
MKKSKISWMVIFLLILFYSCTGYQSQVKCPDPDKLQKKIVKHSPRKNFRINNKVVINTYRSFYKNNKPLPVATKHTQHGLQDIPFLISIKPVITHPVRPEFVSIEKAQSVFKPVNTPIWRSETVSFLNPSEELTKKEYKKEIKEELKYIRKESRELNKAENSGVKATGFAITSFILGVIGLFVFGIPLGILAVVFGGIALSRYKKNPNEKLKGLAIAGLIIGIIAIIGAIIVLASM